MRTLDDLLTAIAEDLIWRRKELTELRAMIQTHRGQLKEKVLIRAAVALLYAHWEGFVKRCASSYLQYVSYQRVDGDKLALNFLNLAARSKALEYIKQGDHKMGMELASFYLSCAGKQARVPYKKVISTQSNLSSSVLKDILETLGLDEDRFSIRMTFIDSNLVNPRNHVAHGESLDVAPADYESLHDDVLGLIEAFRNEIENAAATQAYLRRA
ncbi:hypothetical protein GCM10008101_13410 [Lysobacter xinjiangensis]|uniref:RiboL-PSP-HEPN domain-containing protein n=1 Tax=Cognatilysobacter xinjiangensis TaxID=546892 RepID=A0ABQ3BY40_9GAMM|nr:MAE_28990/MAE_18760 family HEPN-like nuclease [Lysobacter xinjiangensis]GGZ60752.1 hypothetical protein GCM10008101_13410 [Lysobacter xinjiangensis]